MINYIEVSPPKLWRWRWIQSYASKSLSQWSYFCSLCCEGSRVVINSWQGACKPSLYIILVHLHSGRTPTGPYCPRIQLSLLGFETLPSSCSPTRIFAMLVVAQQNWNVLICWTGTSTGCSRACSASCLLQSRTTFSIALIILVGWDWCRRQSLISFCQTRTQNLKTQKRP